jgi:hypothetical protein
MRNHDMTRNVRLAVLQQLAESGRADQMRTANLCPGSDGRDMVAALQSLLDEGLIEPPLEPHELVAAARSGALTLTELGRDRLSHDAA